MSWFLDTNVLLRFLTGDDKQKASACAALFQRAATGEVDLFVSDVCIAELVWTLDSFYELPREEIADKLVAVANTPGFTFTDVHILLDATARYRQFNVDFADAYHAACAHAAGKKVCSYDRDFDRFGDVERVEP
ncbi:MAG: hypothetical protein A3K19_01550 [Lentisphaerae bacterium RIFOXYB12_FULL_65_16]|nr:MAG: hypothetical protein A3K18_22905 [Lentisphaerae bacterium RIFOXYA12_64_32]OGV92825.1 MAG: hypothetical protein A3K19_01550 [Lentisphaerae bacterium RIFOXYB12_FULL_65_16]